jgi:hypothetical protein
MLNYTPRTIQEILDDLIADKESRPELDPLQNPSNVAIWYNVLANVATEIAILENNGVSLYDQIEERALEIPVGTLIWYETETLNFQLGDSLEIINGIPQYSIIDESKQIIKAAAAVEQSGVIVIKCAKENISGDLEPLTAGELSGVSQYWTEKRFAGAPLSIFSVNPDIIKNYLRIEIDGQVLSNTGESLSTPGVYPVEEALKSYYKTLDFGGRFSVMKMIDAAQGVAGVSNVAPVEVAAKADGGSTFIQILNDADQIYISVAGYMEEDPANLLRDTLTYIIKT